MKKTALCLILLTVVFLPGFSFRKKSAVKQVPSVPVQAEDMGKKFKKTCAQLIQFLSQKEVSETDWQINLMKYRAELKALAQEDPKSPWADDAQYLYAELGDPETELVPELEYLLAHFPDSEAEPWTRDFLDFVIPAVSPLDLSVRTELGVNYLKTGQTKKLRELCASSLKKYPKKSRLFKMLLKKSDKKHLL